jgi:hypothetical protein
VIQKAPASRTTNGERLLTSDTWALAPCEIEDRGNRLEEFLNAGRLARQVRTKMKPMAAYRRAGWQQSTVSSNQRLAAGSCLLAPATLAFCWHLARLLLASRSPSARMWKTCQEPPLRTKVMTPDL